MSVTIRKAIPSDAFCLRELNEKFNGISGITVKQIEHSIECNDREEVFVAEKNGALVGFCCVQVFKSFCYAVNYADITEIYIDDSCRRQGIGAMMLGYIERHFEKVNIKSFQLFTGGGNYAAQSFYEKLGYKKTSEIMYRKRR
ncbi:MAG: N-acetyltransferase [Clostridiales bacterium]|nr:N-acetyltransferase [Clostridiales bacterium]